MKPEYSKSAVALQELGITGRLAAVDVTENKALGDEFGVKVQVFSFFVAARKRRNRAIF